jgi:flavin-dependent dehydrogenase
VATAIRSLIVAGAGPAGLAAAIEARARGLEVWLVDPRRGPIDKACGEGLMPGAVAHLAALGVAPDPAWPFVGIRYRRADRPERFADGQFRHGSGLGVQRTVLSAALTARAEAVGVRRLEGKVAQIQQSDGAVTAFGPGLETGLRADALIVADGLRSTLRTHLGLDAPLPRRPGRYGLRQHFDAAPLSNRVEVWWAADCEAYITPVSAQRVGVAFLFRRPSSAEALWARFPGLTERLAGAPAADRPRGAGPFERGSRARNVGNVLLVGDAAGYLDPLTGEGVALGLATARAAVACLAAGRAGDYERAWRRITRRYFFFTEAILRLTGPRALRVPMVEALRLAPWFFDRALGALAAPPPSGVLAAPALSLESTT